MSSSGHKKSKLARISFTLPKSELAAIDALKTRAVAMGTSVKKSALLRAGLMLLHGLNDTDYKRTLATVRPLKACHPPEDTALPPQQRAPAANAKGPGSKRPAPGAGGARTAGTTKRSAREAGASRTPASR